MEEERKIDKKEGKHVTRRIFIGLAFSIVLLIIFEAIESLANVNYINDNVTRIIITGILFIIILYFLLSTAEKRDVFYDYFLKWRQKQRKRVWMAYVGFSLGIFSLIYRKIIGENVLFFIMILIAALLLITWRYQPSFLK